MKRFIDSVDTCNKRQKMFSLKRKLEVEHPSSKRHCTHTCLKRKAEYQPIVTKKLRTDELGALHRMLVDAYAKIEYLELQLRQAKIREQYFTEKTNVPYNHDICCY